jgi:hypothetical protein
METPFQSWKPNRMQLINCADWNMEEAQRADANADTERYERLIKQAAKLQRQAETAPKE